MISGAHWKTDPRLPPSWHALADGVRPPPPEGEGWQHEASPRVECEFRETHLFTQARTPRPSAGAIAKRARRWHVSLDNANVVFFFTRKESHLFRVLLFRRFVCNSCVRSASADVGVLGMRGRAWQLEFAVKEEPESPPACSCC